MNSFKFSQFDLKVYLYLSPRMYNLTFSRNYCSLLHWYLLPQRQFIKAILHIVDSQFYYSRITFQQDFPQCYEIGCREAVRRHPPSQTPPCNLWPFTWHALAEIPPRKYSNYMYTALICRLLQNLLCLRSCCTRGGK